MTDSVLVVGAGPVGLTMAVELARYGVTVRLIDKMTERSDKSRAIAVWPRTLELLDRNGTGAALIGRGNKVTAASIFSDRKRIAHFDLHSVVSPYPFVLMLPQSDTEQVLEQRLAQLGVRSELGVELAGFAQDAEGVTATLRHADGRSETARFAWLVACDGSHSAVRSGLNLGFAGETMGTEWALGDFLLDGAPFPLSDLATYWHEKGPLVLFPLGPGRYRIIYSMGPAGDHAPPVPTQADFQATMDERGPAGITLSKPIWTSVFRINERQVPNYRVGRIFLAGDAAHVHSPAGGQGMNTGMQDAINLAWKLALVCRGLATTPVLLDSYDAERRPVGAEVIASAGRLTKIALLSNPIAQHLRNALAHVMLGLPPVQRKLEGSMTEISVGYPHSPLNAGHGAGLRMAPVDGEAPYGAGDSPRFTLRAKGAMGELSSAARALLDPVVRPGQGIALVRPDGYLALNARDGDWSAVAAYLDGLSRRPH